MSLSNSSKGSEKIELADLGPVNNLTMDEANQLLIGCFENNIEAEIRIASEPYSATILVDLAKRSGVLFGPTSITRGDCFESVDQLEAYAVDRLPLYLAAERAVHIAAGCPDCTEKFRVFSQEVRTFVEALISTFPVVVGPWQDKRLDEKEVVIKRALFVRASAELEQACSRAMLKCSVISTDKRKGE